MKLKWFAGNEEEIFGANGASNAPGEPVQRSAEAAPRLERGLERGTERAVATQAAAESAGGFQSELLPMEDIYRAAGITSPRRGYSVSKVVEMLRSEHLRGASRELRRAAVLMALDAAGVTADEVLQDAKVRQEAIDAYATDQRKHAEAQWARKAEENIQIQAELELVKAHYGEGIRSNLDGVGREKATLGSWLKAKEHETQGMAEAGGQGVEAPGPAEAVAAAPVAVAGVRGGGERAGADAMAEFPGELESGFAASGAAAWAGVATGDSDDGVVAFAIDAAGVGGFLDGGDGQESFHKNFKEFDEAAVFLHGDDERFVFVAEMLLHKLRGFPTD